MTTTAACATCEALCDPDDMVAPLDEALCVPCAVPWATTFLSGTPQITTAHVTRRQLAEDILRAYLWGEEARTIRLDEAVSEITRITGRAP